MPNLFNPDFLDYINLLNKHDVEYVLVGGYAVNLHGFRRSTGDMDLFVNPTLENHQKLRKVHSEFGMHMGEMENPHNFLDTKKYDVYTFGISPIQIDVMTACKGINFGDAFKSSITRKIGQETWIRLVDYEDLIKAKIASGRTRDKMDIEELEKLKRKK